MSCDCFADGCGCGSVDIERLREELRIARWDADVPIRELREENQRLRDQLLECERRASVARRRR